MFVFLLININNSSVLLGMSLVIRFYSFRLLLEPVFEITNILQLNSVRFIDFKTKQFFNVHRSGKVGIFFGGGTFLRAKIGPSV